LIDQASTKKNNMSRTKLSSRQALSCVVSFAIFFLNVSATKAI